MYSVCISLHISYQCSSVASVQEVLAIEGSVTWPDSAWLNMFRDVCTYYLPKEINIQTKLEKGWILVFCPPPPVTPREQYLNLVFGALQHSTSINHGFVCSFAEVMWALILRRDTFFNTLKMADSLDWTKDGVLLISCPFPFCDQQNDCKA